MKKKSLSPAASDSDSNSVFNMNTTFNGELSFDGILRLDGRFSGKIKSDGKLIIGKNGQVSAEIMVETLIVAGQMQGTARAGKRIELHSPAKVFGDIRSPVLIMDEGVVFHGNCRMTGIKLE